MRTSASLVTRSSYEIGFLIAKGPYIRRGAAIDRASVYDVLPTILAYLGEPVADDMKGQPLTGLFEEPLAKRKIEKAPEHLRSLGYIDSETPPPKAEQ